MSEVESFRGEFSSQVRVKMEALSKVLQNSGILLQQCKTSQPRRPQLLYFLWFLRHMLLDGCS